MISLAAVSASSAAPSNSVNDITPGVLGFLVVAAIAVALFLLLLSMNKHLRRVKSVHDAGLAPGGKIDSKIGGASGGGPGRTAANGAGHRADSGAGRTAVGDAGQATSSGAGSDAMSDTAEQADGPTGG